MLHKRATNANMLQVDSSRLLSLKFPWWGFRHQHVLLWEGSSALRGLRPLIILGVVICRLCDSFVNPCVFEEILVTSGFECGVSWTPWKYQIAVSAQAGLV